MKPSLELSQSHVTIGRATLSVLPDKLPLKEFGRPHGHALTRHVMVLLEQLAVCVQQGEPVLLVGETGTGKTSTVQHLSRLTGIFVLWCIFKWFNLIYCMNALLPKAKVEATRHKCYLSFS